VSLRLVPAAHQFLSLARYFVVELRALAQPVQVHLVLSQISRTSSATLKHQSLFHALSRQPNFCPFRQVLAFCLIDVAFITS